MPNRRTLPTKACITLASAGEQQRRKNGRKKRLWVQFRIPRGAIGSAVGLGNIWGFPNKMGANGGFTFLILYLVLAVFCGVIVMIGELALGRKTGHGAIGAYRILSKKFKWLGWMGVLSAFLILGFYCALGGYCLKYVTLNVGNLFHAGFGTGTLDGAGVFDALMANQGECVIYGLLFVAITMIIVMGGVGGGIEKVCSVGMPALFILLIISIIRACTLDGAVEGLKYMFIPGWALDNGIIKEAPSFFSVLSTAGGQMFFSLSLGMAAMITYGSYMDKKKNLQKNAVVIVVMDTVVALMAGLCVIGRRLDPTGNLGGPSLLFVTHAERVRPHGAQWSPIFGIMFYLLVVFAAISSSISLLEWVARFVDKAREQGKGDKRKTYSVLAGIAADILCVVVCLDSWAPPCISPRRYPGHAFHETPHLERRRKLDFGCIAGHPDASGRAAINEHHVRLGDRPRSCQDEIESDEGHQMFGYTFFKICIKYVTPVCMVLVLYGQIKEFFFV